MTDSKNGFNLPADEDDNYEDDFDEDQSHHPSPINLNNQKSETPKAKNPKNPKNVE